MATSPAQSDLATQLEMGWGTCQFGMAERDYSLPDYRTHSRTYFFARHLLRHQPAYLRPPWRKPIYNPFPIFSPPHKGLYSAPATAYISHTLPLPCVLDFRTLPISHRRPRPRPHLCLTALPVYLPLSAFPHHPTARFAKIVLHISSIPLK